MCRDTFWTAYKRYWLLAGLFQPFFLFPCAVAVLSLSSPFSLIAAGLELLSSFWYFSYLVQNWLRFPSCLWIMFLRLNQWTPKEGLKQFHLAVSIILVTVSHLWGKVTFSYLSCTLLKWGEKKVKRVCKKESLEGRKQNFFLLPETMSWTSLNLSWFFFF